MERLWFKVIGKLQSTPIVEGEMEDKIQKADWEEMRMKIVDILYEANGTGSGANDVIEYLQSLKQ